MGIPRDRDARLYNQVARKRLHEATRICDELTDLSAPAAYLAGYAVECVLKALVLVETPVSQRKSVGEETIAWMKSEFGHDLIKLAKSLARGGARLPESQEHDLLSEFNFLAARWDPENRYDPKDYDQETNERMIRGAEAIFQWADARM